MEGLTKRTYCLGAAFALVGGLALFHPNTATAHPSEAALEKMAPQAVDKYSVVPNERGGTNYTYKMDDVTYKALHPYGIVARRYSGDGGKVFDVVLITSDSQESFHDPHICFSAAGWVFTSSTVDTVKIPGRGKMPVTVVEMDGPRKGMIAAYGYRGPYGFEASNKALQLDIFKSELFNQKSSDCTFYRFMPDSEGIGVEDLKRFIAQFMVSAAKSSAGYF